MMRNGDMAVEGREYLHIGAFGKERECRKEKDPDCIFIFHVIEFFCNGEAQSETNKQEEYLGTLF